MADKFRALSHVLSYVPGSSPDCDVCLYCRFYLFVLSVLFF